MVGITLGRNVLSGRIVDFQFFIKFDRSGHGIVFSFLNIVELER